MRAASKPLFVAFKRSEDGAAAIEFALVSMIFILLCLGVLEFGRALQMRNQLSFAADFAARQILTDSDVADRVVEAQVRAKLQIGNPELLDVTFGEQEVDGVNFKIVTLDYPFTLFLPGFSTDTIGLSVNRRVPVT